MWRRALLLLCVSTLFWKTSEGTINVTFFTEDIEELTQIVPSYVEYNSTATFNLTNEITKKEPLQVHKNVIVPDINKNEVVTKKPVEVHKNVIVPKTNKNGVVVKKPIKVQQNVTAATNSTNETVNRVLVPSLWETKKVPGRIVNGTKATRGQFPQQVSLRRRYSQTHFCGGSILTPGWILTAGHCMYDKNGVKLEPYTIIVIAGETVLKNTNAAHQWSYVQNLTVHPKFNINTLENDVALLQLSSPFKFDPWVKPVTIAPTSFPPWSTVCNVSGWGYKIFGGPTVSSDLMFVDVPLLPIPLCRKLMEKYTNVPAGMFCAGYIEGGRDACQGDSGGGMLCNGYLTGVVSGGEGCAWPKLPGLYADAKYYLPWIELYVKDLNKNFTISSTPIRSKAITFSKSGSSMITWSLATLSAVIFNLFN